MRERVDVLQLGVARTCIEELIMTLRACLTYWNELPYDKSTWKNKELTGSKECSPNDYCL